MKRFTDASAPSTVPADRLPPPYATGPLARRLAARTDGGAILFSDVDNTLVCRDDPSSQADLERLRWALDAHQYVLAFVTGNDLPTLARRPELPPPDLVLAAVGTEIWVRQNGAYLLDEAYQALLASHWDRTAVVAALQRAVATARGLLEFQPRDRPDRPRPDQPPQPFKVSLWVYTEDPVVLQAVEEQLRAALPPCALVFSYDTNDPGRYCLDVLPEATVSGDGGTYRGSGKALAVRYVLSRLRPGQAFVAGDSGNDLGMLLDGACPAILVGNATPEARRAVEGLRPERRVGPVLFLPGGHRLYVAPPTERAARAVLAALASPVFNPAEAAGFRAFLP